MINLNLFAKTLFFSSLISGIIIAISANDFLIIWIGLEINLISFLPLIIESNSSISSSNIIKYFLIQTISSFFVLFFILISRITILSLIRFNIVLISILVKIGLPPYHFWLPSIIQTIRWNNCLIISSIQKIIPLILIGSIITISKLFLFLIIRGIFVSALGGFIQTQFRPLIAYSSINHTIWAIISIIYDFYLFLIYFIPYSFSIILLFISLKKTFNSNFIRVNKLKLSPSFIISLLAILSIAGLPPLIGFFPKIIILINLISVSNTIIILLLLGSALNLFYYLNFSFSIIIFNTPYFYNIKEVPVLIPFSFIIIIIAPFIIF